MRAITLLASIAFAVAAAAIFGQAFQAYAAPAPCSGDCTSQNQLVGIFAGGYKSKASGGAVELDQVIVPLLGHRPDVVTDFGDPSSLAAIDNNVGFILGGWSQIGMKVVFGLPMIATGGSLSDCASGTYDSTYHTFVKNLQAKESNEIYLRLGWEFNLGGIQWSGVKSPSDFVACYRHIVGLMRADGLKAKWIWGTFYGPGSMPDPSLAYPGDDVVDIIATDAYADRTMLTEAQFDSFRDRSYGLTWLSAFARAHRKPVAIPEWGSGDNGKYGKYPDSAFFIDKMFDWFADPANNVVEQSYWNSSAGYDSSFKTHPAQGIEWGRRAKAVHP